MVPNLSVIDIEDYFSIFLVNVNDNRTNVERAEWLDEYPRTEGRTRVDGLNGKMKILERELNGFQAWLSLPLDLVFLFPLC